MPIHKVAFAVFCFFFLLVTVAGFYAARWRSPVAGLHSLEEWGLAGRSFGTWITWFLIGGDLYTAYTVIAVPAALYGTGAMGFFAVPYAVIAYPYMMVVLPRLWRVSSRHGYVTFADFVRGRYGNRWLSVAIALTGILALMPYIALQLVGMRVVFTAMGLTGEAPLIIAFVILAAYTYSSGLRAPALIAIVKDTMLYIMVGAAIIFLPIKLGGYAHIFAVAQQQLALHKSSTLLAPSQYLAYSSLAIGSAIALMLYPHTATAVLSAKDANVVRRNAALLPAYSFLLGLIALLGLMALAAGVVTTKEQTTSAAIPLLFLKMFPEWFAGFCLAAIAVGALVPAAHVHRRRESIHTQPARRVPPRESHAAGRVHHGQAVSLAVKFGALAFILKVPTPYAIQMQLLGGIWIAQLFPSVVIGAFTRWMNPWALLCGWASGMTLGTWMAEQLALKSSVYPVHLFGSVYPMYAAVPALLLNLAVSALLTLLMRAINQHSTTDSTLAEDYV